MHTRLLHSKMRICFVVASFALWFCDCAIVHSILLSGWLYKDKGSISNWNKTSWRGNLPQTIGQQLVQKPQSCSAQSFTQPWHKHKLEWQKLMVVVVVIGLTDGFVHASIVVVLTLPVWNDKRENSFRWKIQGKSGENLWNTVLLSGVLILSDSVCLS